MSSRLQFHVRPGAWAWLPALTLALAAASAQAELRYRVQNLGLLNGSSGVSGASGINNQGWAVGYSRSADEELLSGFLYRDGRMQALGSLNGAQSVVPRDINDSGQVVGGVGDHSFLYSEGQVMDLSQPFGGSRRGYGYRINRHGQATGSMDDGNGTPVAFISDGKQGRLITLEGATRVMGLGINDQGVVAGYADLPDSTRAFVHDGTRTTLLPLLNGHLPHSVAAINNAGQMAVNVWHGDDLRVYLYGSDGPVELGTLGGEFAAAWGLNERGWVVGHAGTASGDIDPFVYREGRMHNLNGILRPEDNRHWQLIDAQDINDRGQIVGYGRFNGEFRAFLATPVPEPGSWALLLLGLGVAGWRWKSRTVTR